MSRQASIVLVALASLGLFGCQPFIASIKSPSDSISGTANAIGGVFGGISQSSSGSNPSGVGGSAALQLEDDLRVAAREYVGGDADPRSFSAEIGRLSAEYGVADWEAESHVLTALGRGLLEAGLAAEDADRALEDLGLDADARATALGGFVSTGS